MKTRPRSGTNAASIGGVARDVLQVRLAAAHATTGRADQVVVGVDPSRDRVDVLEVAVAVGGDLLLEHAFAGEPSRPPDADQQAPERRFVRVRKVDPDGFLKAALSCGRELRLSSGSAIASFSSSVVMASLSPHHEARSRRRRRSGRRPIPSRRRPAARQTPARRRSQARLLRGRRLGLDEVGAGSRHLLQRRRVVRR